MQHSGSSRGPAHHGQRQSAMPDWKVIARSVGEVATRELSLRLGPRTIRPDLGSRLGVIECGLETTGLEIGGWRTWHQVHGDRSGISC